MRCQPLLSISPRTPIVAGRGCPLYGTVVLCQAGSAAAFRARASTAWEGGTPACFVVARGITLRYSAAALASAALSLRRDGRLDGSSGAVARQTHLLPAARALCGRCESNLAACKALEGAASARARWHCAAAQLVHVAAEQSLDCSKGAGALPGSLGIAACNPAWESCVTRRRRTARAPRHTSKRQRRQSYGQPWRRPSASTTR